MLILWLDGVQSLAVRSLSEEKAVLQKNLPANVARIFALNVGGFSTVLSLPPAITRLMLNLTNGPRVRKFVFVTCVKRT